MRIDISLEGKYEGRFIAWALDYPGCFGYGADEQEAVVRFPQDFLAYQSWVNFKCGSQSWLREIQDFDIRVVESFQNFYIDEQYQFVDEDDGVCVCSWFHKDWLPLTRLEIEQTLRLLDWSRKDLLDVYRLVPAQAMHRRITGERWTIAGIFTHVANAEWWYLDRLELAPCAKNELPDDPLERMAAVRQNLIAVLPKLQDSELVRGKAGEFWSPRKVVRRALWHEKDHLVHIQKLLAF